MVFQIDDRKYPGTKAEYRQMLEKRPLKEIIPVSDSDIRDKIQEVWRLRFLREAVFSRFIEESTNSVLGGVIHFGEIDLVTHFTRDHKYLKALLNIVSDDEETPERKKDVVGFLYELCLMARGIAQPMYKMEFYRYASF